MRQHRVYRAGKASGIVRLDPEGNIVEEHPEDLQEKSPEPPPPPPEPPVDVDAIKKSAYLQGFEDGKQEAIQSVQAQLDALRVNMQNLMQRIPQEVRNIIAQGEPQLLDLALALARRVLQTEIKQNRDVIKNVLKHAMEQVKNQTVIAIHMHPSDIEEIQPQFPDGRVELIPDTGIQPGGCRIETDMGEMDATIESQWAALEKAMKEKNG